MPLADRGEIPTEPGIECGIAVSVDTKPVLPILTQPQSNNRGAEVSGWGQNDERQVAATDAYINWLASEFKPLDTADSESFAEFIQSLHTSWVPPSGQKGRECIQQKFYEIREKIAASLSEVI